MQIFYSEYLSYLATAYNDSPAMTLLDREKTGQRKRVTEDMCQYFSKLRNGLNKSNVVMKLKDALPYVEKLRMLAQEVSSFQECLDRNRNLGPTKHSRCIPLVSFWR